jgi:cytochrome c oxidase assembly factor CtaG
VTVPRPDLLQVLTAWGASPELVVPIVVVAGGYWRAVVLVRRRFPGNPWPNARTAAFLAGLAVVAVAVLSPVDRYSDVLLWVHMVQHLLLTLVAGPLLLLGAPLLLAMRSSGGGRGRRTWTRMARGRLPRTLSHPLFGWVAFAGVLVGTHFTPLYQAALERGSVHALEHGLYLVSALLFWWPVVARDPTARRMSYPLRLLYLVVLAPVNTIVAVAIATSGELLYPHYGQILRDWGPSPLLDQAMAGSVMWVAGDLALVTAGALVLAGWMRHDRKRSDHDDARDDDRRTAERVDRTGGGSWVRRASSEPTAGRRTTAPPGR